MRKLLILTIAFLICVFALDYFLSLILSKVVSDAQVDRRVERIMEGNENSQVLIFGSSRAAKGLLADTLCKNLGVSVYNYGFTGSNIDFQETLLQLLLAKNKQKPQLIILVTDNLQQFSEEKTLAFRLDRLYPWAKYPEIKEIIKQSESVNALASWSNSYLYKKCDITGALKNIAQEKNISKQVKTAQCDVCPLMQHSASYDTMKYVSYFPYSATSENKRNIQKTRSFISLCKQNNINLLLLFPPNYHPFSEIQEQRMVDLFGSTKNVFFYFEKRSKYQNKNLFYDKFHLNYMGAKEFSNDVAEYLKQELIKK